TDPRLMPAGRDNVLFHIGTLDAVEKGWLMKFVQRSDRHEKTAGPEIDRIDPLEIDIGEFQLHLLRRMLEVDLDVEAQPVIESITPSQHQSVKIEGRT